MKQNHLGFLAAALLFTSCLPKKQQTGDVTNSAQQPAECVGGEFAIRGFNKKSKPECLDVTHYPVLKHFSNPDEYKQIAERFGMSNALQLIRTKGVEAAQQEYQLVANFKHDNTLWVAQIPTRKKAIRSVFQASEFIIPLSKALDAVPPDVRAKIEDLAKTNDSVQKELDELKSGRYTTAHGQLRVQFSEAVQLVDAKNAAHRDSLWEIVLSVHAASPGTAPDTYDPIKGFQNEYGTALGIFSLGDKVNQAIARHVQQGKEPSRVRQYQLDLAPEKLDAVLVAYFSKAKSVWDNLAYNTLARNCGSEVFEVLDDVLGFDKSKDDALSALGRQYPKYAQFGLLKRGLVSLKPDEKPDAVGAFRDDQLANPMPTLNAEMSFPEPR